MKEVLISIQPRWCEKIASGSKTVEVRKTAPKTETPFKCYIYCTKGNPKDPHQRIETHGVDGKIRLANGTVFAEFICDEVRLGILDVSEYVDSVNIGREETGLRISDIKAYLGMKYVERKGQHKFYGWHISNLVIYDEPKRIDELIVKSDSGCCNEGKCRQCIFFDKGNGFNVEDDCTATFDTDEYRPLRRPPQSWCYVERTGERREGE